MDNQSPSVAIIDTPYIMLYDKESVEDVQNQKRSQKLSKNVG